MLDEKARGVYTAAALGGDGACSSYACNSVLAYTASPSAGGFAPTSYLSFCECSDAAGGFAPTLYLSICECSDAPSATGTVINLHKGY